MKIVKKKLIPIQIGVGIPLKFKIAFYQQLSTNYILVMIYYYNIQVPNTNSAYCDFVGIFK